MNIDQVSYIFIAAGVIFSPLSFVTGTSTLSECDFTGIFGTIYDTIGIYIPGYSVEIDLTDSQSFGVTVVTATFLRCFLH